MIGISDCRKFHAMRTAWLARGHSRNFITIRTGQAR